MASHPALYKSVSLEKRELRSHCRLRHAGIAITAVATFLLSPMTGSAASATRHFEAELMPLNASVGGGARGTVKLTIEGDALTIRAKVTGLSPGMHMIHIHGFATGDKAAACAGAAQDQDSDGIIDLLETEPVSGTTLIPFHDQPATLKLPSDNYPKADAAGSFSYRQTVSLRKLNTALQKQFGIERLDLDKRVIYVHGVPDGTKLPATVKSLPGVPANATLPVACGVIREVR